MSARRHSMELWVRRYGLWVREKTLPLNVPALWAKGTRYIAVDRRHHPCEQQFAIAHEAGHGQLHKNDVGVSPSKEWDANFFAYGLLFVARRFDVLRYRLRKYPFSIFPAILAAAIASLAMFLHRHIKRRRAKQPK